MKSFKELIQKANDLTKEELIKEILPTMDAETKLREQCMSEIRYDIQRFKGEYLQTAKIYKGQKLRLNTQFFHYDKKKNADLYLYFWTYYLSFFAEFLSESFKDVAYTIIAKSNPESNVCDEIEINFY